MYLYRAPKWSNSLMFNVKKIFGCLASRAGRGPAVWSRGWSIHHLAAALHGLYGLYDGPCSLEFISISIPDQYCDEYTLFVIWRFFLRNCFKQIVSTWYWEDLAGKGPKRSCRLSLEYCVFITVSISTELYSSILSPLDSDPEAEVRVRGHVARRPQSRTSPGHARTRGPRTQDTARVRPTLYAALISKPTFTDFNLESVEDVLLLYSDGFPKLFFGVSSKFWDISTQ